MNDAPVGAVCVGLVPPLGLAALCFVLCACRSRNLIQASSPRCGCMALSNSTQLAIPFPAIRCHSYRSPYSTHTTPLLPIHCFLNHCVTGRMVASGGIAVRVVHCETVTESIGDGGGGEREQQQDPLLSSAPLLIPFILPFID